MKAPRKIEKALLKPISEEPVFFGRIIAEREYRVGRVKYLLQVGSPRRASWKTDCYCAFKIVGPGEPLVRRVFGLDELQALMLVFDIIKVSLEGISPRIRWDGSQTPGDVGVYKRLSSGFGGADFDKKLEGMVDRAISARARQLGLESRRRGRAKRPTAGGHRRSTR